VHVVIDESSAGITPVVPEGDLMVEFHPMSVIRRGRLITTGQVMCNLAFQEDDLVMFMDDHERWFVDHVSKLVRLFEETPSLQLVKADYLIQHFDPDGKEYRDYFPASRTLPKYSITGSYLTRWSLWAKNAHSLKYLAGPYLIEALQYLSLGASATTDSVSYMKNISEPPVHDCWVEADIQQRVVRDIGMALNPGTEFGANDASSTFAQLAASFDDLTFREKQHLSLMVLRNAPLPRPIMRVVLWIYKLLTWPSRRKSQ
jgi:hypothetical protein